MGSALITTPKTSLITWPELRTVQFVVCAELIFISHSVTVGVNLMLYITFIRALTVTILVETPYWPCRAWYLDSVKSLILQLSRSSDVEDMNVLLAELPTLSTRKHVFKVMQHKIVLWVMSSHFRFQTIKTTSWNVLWKFLNSLQTQLGET